MTYIPVIRGIAVNNSTESIVLTMYNKFYNVDLSYINVVYNTRSIRVYRKTTICVFTALSMVKIRSVACCILIAITS